MYAGMRKHCGDIACQGWHRTKSLHEKLFVLAWIKCCGDTAAVLMRGNHCEDILSTVNIRSFLRTLHACVHKGYVGDMLCVFAKEKVVKISHCWCWHDKCVEETVLART